MKIKCPKCGSENIRLASTLPNELSHCYDCKHLWRQRYRKKRRSIKELETKISMLEIEIIKLKDNLNRAYQSKLNALIALAEGRPVLLAALLMMKKDAEQCGCEENNCGEKK